MSLTVSIPKEYGYVLLAASSTFILSIVHAFNAGSCRKKAKVPYPAHYATDEAVKENPDAYIFNCAQRAHANYMENLPIALPAMLIAGFAYPLTAAGLGFGWSLQRYIYMVGYTKPSWGKNGMGRMRGGGYLLCQLGLVGMVGWMGLQMVL